jgi:hypothetical protein
MKDRLLTLLIGLGLLGTGIDRIFFDKIAGDDLLAVIHNTGAIVAGCLLGVLGISLFVAALRGRHNPREWDGR